MCLWAYVCTKSSLLLLEHIKDMNWNELEEFYPFAPPKEIVGTQLRLAESGMLIDLTPYIQIAPHTFEKDGSAERAYVLFRSLGLRYVLVYSCAASILTFKSVMGV